MTGHHTPRNKAAKLAALLPLWQSGALDHMTLQQVADLVGVRHRSTARRDLLDLPEVARLARLYSSRLPHPRKRIHKRNPN